MTFIVVTLLGVWATIEFFIAVVVFISQGSIGRVYRHRREIATHAPDQISERRLPTMIHPYLGAVLQPVQVADGVRQDGGFRATEFGFWDNSLPIHRRSKDRVIVAILGGSVARQMATDATQVLEQELRKIPMFAGRSVQLVRLAVDGFKQPQQLMAMNYLMSLGAEFDIVINLDGVNEAALPKMDNVPFGVSAAYLRKWGTMMSSSGSMKISRMVGHIEHLKYRQHENAQLFEMFPLGHLPSGWLFWSLRNARFEREIIQQEIGISKVAQDELSYCASGPPEQFHSDQELFEHCASLWARSSLLLHRQCVGQRATYFHFLQPNQYLTKTKPMESTEAKIAINSGSPFRLPVVQCYPIMQLKGAELKSEGVAFTDLTRVFADHPEPIYIDDCCHVGEQGSFIMARAITDRIQQFYLSEH